MFYTRRSTHKRMRHILLWTSAAFKGQAVDLEVEGVHYIEMHRGQTFVGTLHCVLENRADLYVNECQTIRHYHCRSAEERRRRKNKNAKS